jgi:adenylylsulfate kinase-like enzyme
VNLQAQKSWTFVPSRSNRYEFDVGLLFIATAFSRGLFKYDTIEELLDGDEVHLPLNDDVNKQAVFLGSDRAEKLRPDVPMRKFNPKQCRCRQPNLVSEHC